MLNKIKNFTYKLLKKSESFFQTDMIYLARGGFWLTLGQIVASLSSFIIAIAFANLLSKETYGIYKYVLSIAGIILSVSLSGISTSIIKSIAGGSKSSIIPILKSKIGWSFFGSLISIIIATYYFINHNTTLFVCFLIISIFIPFIDSFSIYNSILIGKKEFRLATKYNIISSLFYSLTFIITLILTKNIYYILFSYFLSWTLIKIIFFKITIKKYDGANEYDSNILKYGKHLTLMNILGSISNYIDRLLIFHVLGAVEVAIYSIALAPIEQLKSLSKNINTLIFTKYSDKKNISIVSINKKIRITIIGVILLIVIYFLSISWLFKIFFPKYLDGILYSQIASLILIFYIPSNILLSILQSQEKIKSLYRYNIFAPICQIIIMIFFAYLWGIMGIIVAKILSSIINLISLSIFLKKEYSREPYFK